MGACYFTRCKFNSLCPTTNQDLSPLHFTLGYQSHLSIFGCGVYVPIAPTHRNKMGPQRCLGIYVGFQYSSIIKYLEPLTNEVFTTRFADCHFDENVFLPSWENSQFQNNYEKLHRINPLYLISILIQSNLNKKFKR